MKIGNDEILYINALQQESNVTARDCFLLNKKLVYLVEASDTGKVIGKQGKIVKQLSQKMNKQIQIVSHYDDLKEFLENFFKTRVKEIEVNGKEAVIRIGAMDRKKIMLNRQTFDLAREIVKRSYGIEKFNIR